MANNNRTKTFRILAGFRQEDMSVFTGAGIATVTRWEQPGGTSPTGIPLMLLNAMHRLEQVGVDMGSLAGILHGNGQAEAVRVLLDTYRQEGSQVVKLEDETVQELATLIRRNPNSQHARDARERLRAWYCEVGLSIDLDTRLLILATLNEYDQLTGFRHWHPVKYPPRCPECGSPSGQYIERPGPKTMRGWRCSQCRYRFVSWDEQGASTNGVMLVRPITRDADSPPPEPSAPIRLRPLQESSSIRHLILAKIQEWDRLHPGMKSNVIRFDLAMENRLLELRENEVGATTFQILNIEGPRAAFPRLFGRATEWDSEQFGAGYKDI